MRYIREEIQGVIIVCALILENNVDTNKIQNYVPFSRKTNILNIYLLVKQYILYIYYTRIYIYSIL